jgi:hypothetical protein
MITNTVINIETPHRLLIVPSFAISRGRLVRPSPFSSADAVFSGTVADAARQFLAGTTARVFHLHDVDKDASSAESIATAAELRELGDVQVLLEGGLSEIAQCLAISARGITPIADEALVDRLWPVAEDASNEGLADVLFGLRGDDDAAFERVARALECGLWGVVHHSSNPAFSCGVARRLAGKMPFYSREPMATPDLVEDVIMHHRRLVYGQAPAVIVDGEWYVDYNSLNAPFDLLR